MRSFSLPAFFPHHRFPPFPPPSFKCSRKFKDDFETAAAATVPDFADKAATRTHTPYRSIAGIHTGLLKIPSKRDARQRHMFFSETKQTVANRNFPSCVTLFLARWKAGRRLFSLRPEVKFLSPGKRRSSVDIYSSDFGFHASIVEPNFCVQKRARSPRPKGKQLAKLRACG